MAGMTQKRALEALLILRNKTLILCLKSLILLGLFRFSFRLFHKEGPVYDKDFSPMFVLRRGIFNFWKEERVRIAVSSVGKNNSSK